ncbi:MAG: alkaline phosphatase D family protein [Hyphomicrobium aestuarii]|mgnify:CR=1 FL=1|nr:alkaline phosphatase D family protein [Hyphomicrobium aestuarii]
MFTAPMFTAPMFTAPMFTITHSLRRSVCVMSGLLAAVAIVIAGCSCVAQAQPTPAPVAQQRVVSAPLPSPETALTRVAFGSCLNQTKPQPIWAAVIAAKPDLMVMTGDNVYGSTIDDTLEPLKAAYAGQAANAEFRAARERLPMLAIWDDHDFGRNDGGGDYALKARAADMFDAFWGPLPDRPASGSLYHARSYGPLGRRVQIILLDTRFYRSSLQPKSPAFPHWGRYEPDPDPAKTMLGEAQWRWLESQLAQPADVRIIVSSIQVLAEGHGFERWGNLPNERARLLRLVERTAGRTVFVSGDRHYGAFYDLALPSNATLNAPDVSAPGTKVSPPDRTIVEMTASAMNMASGRPAQDARMAPLVSDIVGSDNFGLASIDWEARTLTLSLQGSDGAVFASRNVRF